MSPDARRAAKEPLGTLVASSALFFARGNNWSSRTKAQSFLCCTAAAAAAVSRVAFVVNFHGELMLREERVEVDAWVLFFFCRNKGGFYF